MLIRLGLEEATRRMFDWDNRYYRWMYRKGRPNWWARPQNRLATIVSNLLPSRMVTLQVVGRRTGRMISVPLVVGDFSGERYLVSMLGPDANWVRNVRAAGGTAVLRQGRRRKTVHLDEVDMNLRPPILRRYLERAPGARPHIRVDRRSPLAAFEHVAADYPVFHINDDPSAPQPKTQSGVPHL